MTVESRRAAQVPTGAVLRGRRRFLPPPLWRFAPRRLLHDVVTLTLMLGVLTLLSVAAAAGPIHAEAVSDAAVRLTLESVPAGAPAKTAAVNLLVVDPARFASAAAWGSPGGPVAEGRALLPALAADDAAAAAYLRRNGLGSPVPVLLVGAVGDLGLEVGSTVTVDTLNDPVRLEVRGLLDAFPGAGSGPPTFVVPADSFFAAQLNNDPRLRPAPATPRNRPVDFQTYLWSTSGTAAAETLAAHSITADLIGTLAQERTTPVYVAADQARRYQVALGLVFGAVGLAAVALAAVRLARRSPAADRMLAWTGTGRHAPARARALEVAIVLALSCALSALALLALRPLAHLLLEPGDGRAPEAVLALPGSVLVAAAGWLTLAAVAALAGMLLATSSQSTVEVLRGEE